LAKINNKKTMAWKTQKVKRDWQLYLLLAIPLAWVLVFRYAPMYGLQMAFRDFVIRDGIWGSPWVGLKYFEMFVTSHQFPRLMFNTIGISLYTIVAGFFPL